MTAHTVIWAPQPGPQTELLRCPVFEVFFGGARGGGKTDGMIGDFAQHAHLYGKHATGKFFRKTLIELQQTISRAKEIYAPIGAKWVDQPKNLFTFPNGATLGFAYLERDDDADGYMGHAYTWIGVEEQGNFANPKPLAKLRATLRSAHGVPCSYRATANPGGPGHHWNKERYIDPAPGGMKIIRDEHGLERVYIPSRLENNRILVENDPDYAARLKTTGSEQLVKAWLSGDWDIVEGAFFDCWSSERHVVRPVELPDHWTRFTSFDWGSSKPFSQIWYAVSDGTLPQFPRGALVVYREWYGCSAPNVGLKMLSQDIAAGILEREGKDAKGKPKDPMRNEKVAYRVGDPACWKAEDGPSIAEKMAQAQVMMNPADNSRISGWEQVRSRLVGSEDTGPMLYVFNTCPHLIRTVPALQHDKHKAEDVDDDAEDHAADSLRYGCMSRPYTRVLTPAAPIDKYRRKRPAAQASGWAA